MTGEGNRGDSSESEDSLMREIAHAPEAAPPKEPERLGRFRITGRLGAGGMGIVYRAEDESLHRTVAIKVLRPSFHGDEVRRKRLVREARAAAAVTHPNIAAVHEIGESEGRIFLAMEYVRGSTLRALLRDGPMPLSKALPIALQIAEGLAKAHRADIVHRDLKPDNIIVSVDGPAKILDFGLAKLRASEARDTAFAHDETVTEDGRMVGTPAYTSPEQARGKDVGPPSDVFAFGVTLYELVTGQRPFAGSSLADLIIAIDRDVPKPASSTGADVPEELDDLLAKCLAKDPRERFANGEELVAALTEISSLTSTTPRSVRTVSEGTTSSDLAAVRTPRDAPTKRRSAFWMGLAALALAVLSAFGYRTKTPPTSSAGGNANAVAAQSASEARTWVRMTERPPPKSSSPAALAAYRVAMQDLRDASTGHAHWMMKTALKEDPQLAAAHLRECLHTNGNQAQRADSDLSPSAHYHRAVALREALDEHDRALLGVADALYATEITDETLALTRAREARARFPGDEEIELEAAILQSELGGPSAFDALRDLVARTSPFALAEWYLLDPGAFIGDRAAWRAAAQRCVAGTPQAASCLSKLSLIANIEGDCQEFETTRRRRVAMDPESPGAHRYLGFALASNGAPYDVVFEEFKSLRERELAYARANVYMMTGHFTAAESDLASAQADFERDADDEIGGDILVLRAQAAEESGNLPAASEMAKRAIQKPTVRNGSRYLQVAVGIVHHAGGQPAAHILDLSMPLPGAPLPSTSQRLQAEAGFLGETADDETSARAALEAFKRIEERVGDAAWIDTDVAGRYLRGRARLLTGDVGGAAEDLGVAARFCHVEDNPFASPRAALLLGQVRESQNDQPAACAAYATVLARWGNAKPRSVTADKARARSKALRCPQ